MGIYVSKNVYKTMVVMEIEGLRIKQRHGNVGSSVRKIIPGVANVN